MTAQKPRKKAKRAYKKHGHSLLKRAINTLGSRGIDKRTKLARALAQWRNSLVEDLGGPEALSTQQEAILDLAVRTKLMLDSIDVWLLQQPSLVNLRKRTLLPVVLQRQQLADSLARYMTTLGLERKQKPVPALSEYLAERYQDKSAQNGDDSAANGSEAP